MTWWISLTSSTGGSSVREFATENEAAYDAANYIALGAVSVTTPARREDTSFSPQGLAALAGLIRLEEDRDQGRLAEGVYTAAVARASEFGYFEPEMAIVSDWFTGYNSTWEETLDFLDDPFTLEWLARMVVAGWDPYDVNHRPVTDARLRTVMASWPALRQDECLAWVRAQETADHRFESPHDALGQWIRRDIDTADDDPAGERCVFVPQDPDGGVAFVDVVSTSGELIKSAVTSARAIAKYGHCRMVSSPPASTSRALMTGSSLTAEDLVTVRLTRALAQDVLSGLDAAAEHAGEEAQRIRQAPASDGYTEQDIQDSAQSVVDARATRTAFAAATQAGS